MKIIQILNLILNIMNQNIREEIEKKLNLKITPLTEILKLNNKKKKNNKFLNS